MLLIDIIAVPTVCDKKDIMISVIFFFSLQFLPRDAL